MSVGLRVIPFSGHNIRISAVDVFSSTRPVVGIKITCSLNVSTTNDQNLIEKIRERIISNGKVELSPSAYDTAWVAMVPSKEYSGSKQPCFPQCLDWIMANQNGDGSWGLDPGHPYLVKDSLSCTLACLLALRKWDVGQQLVERGLDFIGSNGWAASHKDQYSPIGFNIIFPGMVNYAKELNLTLPLTPALVHSLLHIRDSDIRRNQNLEYVAEGLGNSCNWKEIIMKHQRSNGSLFNSPATTAAALIHSHDDKCYEYLTSVLSSGNKWVPTVYPMDIYTCLCMVDTLEKLGISRYYGCEIGCILDEIYRCWQAKAEELFSDVTSRAMAFRLLRTKGYDVSSDELTEFVDQEHFFNEVSLLYKGVTTVLELYRASQLRIYEEEHTLEKIHAWTSSYLMQQLLNKSILNKRLQKQVEYDLKNFYGTLDRVGNRRSIEQHDAQDFQLLKTAFRSPRIHNEDFILFSFRDFRISQAQFGTELQQIERFDHLNQGRNVSRITYNLAAAIFVDPELSDARVSYVQLTVLTTCWDDFFDLYGSKEEALQITELVRNWNMQPTATYCSEQVEILFSGLYKTVNDIAAKASAKQGPWVKNHLVNMCLEALPNFAVPWSNNDNITLDEYLSSACKTINCRQIILTSFLLIGIKLDEDIFTSTECTNLCYHASVVCRLLNDLNTFKREREEGTQNSVSLLTAEGAISEEEALLKVRQIIEYHRRKLLQMVYQRKKSVVPRECKDIFWKTCQICYYLYPHDGGDAFSSPQEFAKDLNSIIWKRIHLSSLST